MGRTASKPAPQPVTAPAPVPSTRGLVQAEYDDYLSAWRTALLLSLGPHLIDELVEIILRFATIDTKAAHYERVIWHNTLYSRVSFKLNFMFEVSLRGSEPGKQVLSLRLFHGVSHARIHETLTEQWSSELGAEMFGHRSLEESIIELVKRSLYSISSGPLYHDEETVMRIPIETATLAIVDLMGGYRCASTEYLALGDILPDGTYRTPELYRYSLSNPRRINGL